MEKRKGWEDRDEIAWASSDVLMSLFLGQILARYLAFVAFK